MSLHLKITYSGNVPLEVESILPSTLRAKSLGDIQRLPIAHGNRKEPLAEFFDVSGDPSDERIEWQGDLTGVHWIGCKMDGGQMHIEGSAGRHLGSQMLGGRIVVEGDVSDWLGGEMAGGEIHVHGSAGHLVGAAYRGSVRGMTGGSIFVDGDTGNELGHSMRRGLVAVGGNAGDLIGFNMLAGSLLVFGDTGIRHGAGMRRGTIGLFGPNPPTPLISFHHACRRSLYVLRLLAQTLRHHAFPIPHDLPEMVVDLFHGDMIEGGRGELLMRAT